MASLSTLFGRMHLPFRRSGAPVLRALTAALERGLSGVRVGDAAAAMHLESAHEEWLDEYAALHAYVRLPGERDEALRARMRAQTATLERMKTTTLAIAAAVERATGVPAQVRLSRPMVASFDDLEAMGRGERMLDYARHDRQGQLRFEIHSESARGYQGRGPWRPGYGPGGMVIDVRAPHTPELERQVVLAVRDHVPSMTGFDLSWAKAVKATWVDGVGVDDAALRCQLGFGESPFGSAPFGDRCDRFGFEGGWGEDRWGEDWGSTRRTLRRRSALTAQEA